MVTDSDIRRLEIRIALLSALDAGQVVEQQFEWNKRERVDPTSGPLRASGMSPMLEWLIDTMGPPPLSSSQCEAISVALDSFAAELARTAQAVPLADIEQAAAEATGWSAALHRNPAGYGTVYSAVKTTLGNLARHETSLFLGRDIGLSLAIDQ